MIISHARVHFTRFGTQLGDQFELGSSVSHFHYNYHETDMIAHMGHKVCLNVGSVVLARSWLLSGARVHFTRFGTQLGDQSRGRHGLPAREKPGTCQDYWFLFAAIIQDIRSI
jgi:hypothetical protein